MPMNQMEQRQREPIFAPGGLRRLGLWGLGLAISMAIAVCVAIVMSPLEPIVRGAVASLF